MMYVYFIQEFIFSAAMFGFNLNGRLVTSLW